MDNCIFCKIVSDEIPSYKIYEDDFFIAILDRFPSSLGHTLIIPKKHFDNIFDIEKIYSKNLFSLVSKISLLLKKELNFEGLNILQNNGEIAGQTVNHLHVHLIPRYTNDKISINWQHIDPSENDFKKLADILKQ